jgi:hypothetical protein
LGQQWKKLDRPLKDPQKRFLKITRNYEVSCTFYGYIYPWVGAITADTLPYTVLSLVLLSLSKGLNYWLADLPSGVSDVFE